MDYVDVSSVFNPLYLHSRLFGCNLFHLPKSHKTRTVAVKLTDMLILVVYVVLYAWLFLSINYAQSGNDQILRKLLFNLTEKTGSLIMVFVGRVLFYTFGATNCLICIMDLVNRNRIWKLLCEIHGFDSKMKKLGVLSNRYITRNRFVAYTALIAVIYLTNACISYLIYKYRKLDDFVVVIRFYAGAQLSDGCFASFLTIFIFFLFSISERFRKINQIVTQFYHLREDLNDLPYPLEHNFRIHEIAKLYSQLSGIVRLASETYSIQVMFAILSTSSFSLISVFMIYKIVTAFEFSLLIGSLVYISRAIYFNILFFLVIRLSTAISIESKRTASLLNKAINKSGNNVSINQLEQFSYQVTHCTNELTCGLFKFDWNIVHVIVGASLTYLTYFIQFDQQMENAILIN